MTAALWTGAADARAAAGTVALLMLLLSAAVAAEWVPSDEGTLADSSEQGTMPACGDLNATQNSLCKSSVEWAFADGVREAPEKYFTALGSVSVVTLSKATIADFQRLFYCGVAGNESTKCGLPPCSCSSPPCSVCEHPVTVQLEKPFVLVKRYDLAENPAKEFDVVVIPDENMTHSCANYVDDGSTVLSRNGSLVLRVSSACAGGGCLNSGRVMSKESFTHGIFSFTATVPKCNRLWPALWLLPNNTKGDGLYGPWPCSGEIDMLETVHGDPFGAFNLVAGYGSTGGAKGYCFPPAEHSCNACAPPNYCTSTTLLPDMEAGRYYVEDVNCSAKERPSWSEHTFLLYWQPDKIATFIDPKLTYDALGQLVGLDERTHVAQGNETRRSYKAYERRTTPTWRAVEDYMQRCFPGAHASDAPFDRGFKLVMNIAIGGYGGAPCTWGSPTCSTECGGAVGSEMVVSDISVWQRT